MTVAQIVFRSYLVAWLFAWGIAQGGLALVMIHHLTGGAWGVAMRRICEAQMRTLPLVALLFLPVALGAGQIYPWAAPPEHVENPFLNNYFEPQFVWGRAIGYFAIWIALASLLSHWSRAEDQGDDLRAAYSSHNLSGPGLVLYGVTLHFAAIDWMMSVQPSFTSTIFGPIVAAGQLLSAFAFAILALNRVKARPELADVLSSSVLLDLGNLLFTLVIVWSYLLWCQFMLIWIGDLPRDNVWWLIRGRGGWMLMGLALAVLGFAVPFFLLLLRAIKHDLRKLAVVAALVLAMQFVFAVYQVVPAFAEPSWIVIWLSLAFLIAIGGAWLACFSWLFSQRPSLPPCDRNWPQVELLWKTDQDESARQEAQEAMAHG